MTRSMVVGVTTLAIVALVGAMAFGVLFPVFGPGGAPLSMPTAESEPDEWGPLAVATGPGNGDEALTTGALRISDQCVVLESTDDRPTLLVWSGEQARWDPRARQIVFRSRGGEVFQLRDGQRVGLGGSGRGLSAEVLSPGEWDGLVWDDWLPTIDWAAPPHPTCRADSVWSVGDVVPDSTP